MVRCFLGRRSLALQGALCELPVITCLRGSVFHFTAPLCSFLFWGFVVVVVVFWLQLHFFNGQLGAKTSDFPDIFKQGKLTAASAFLKYFTILIRQLITGTAAN